MFAGAVREAVFSRPEVVKQVRESFIPVSIRAQHVNSLRTGAEGKIFGELSKSRPAGQGLAVLNSDGQALEWVLMFDDPTDIGKFFDHSLERFKSFPTASSGLLTERHMRYPSQTLPEMRALNKAVSARHAKGEKCSGDNSVAEGSVRFDLIGRTLTQSKEFSKDVLTQDNFVQDMFDLDSRLQKQIIDSVNNADGKRFELPSELSKAVQEHAYLGQLDACPIPNPHGGTVTSDVAELYGTVVNSSGGDLIVKIEGQTEAASSFDRGGRPMYNHSVLLDWDGFMVINRAAIKRFALIGRGNEKFQWFHGGQSSEEAVSFLQAGHKVDQEGPVQYGLILRTPQ